MKASLVLCSLVMFSRVCVAETLDFAGYKWDQRPEGEGGPGPNNWEPRNVWVDEKGQLHLKLTSRNGKWYAAEVHTQKRLGFGRYEFQVSGPVDKLDRNIVFGIFNYPTSDLGPDGTCEIDIEFAHWGNPKAPV